MPWEGLLIPRLDRLPREYIIQPRDFLGAGKGYYKTGSISDICAGILPIQTISAMGRDEFIRRARTGRNCSVLCLHQTSRALV